MELYNCRNSYGYVDWHALPEAWSASYSLVIGGTLGARGGFKASRNYAVSCTVLIAIIEGVGIVFTRMLADNTRLDPPPTSPDATAY